MPDEKNSGMLIGPMGSPAEPLGDYQHPELTTCLRILEGSSEIPRDMAFFRALRHLLRMYRDGKSLSDIPIQPGVCWPVKLRSGWRTTNHPISAKMTFTACSMDGMVIPSC